MALYRAEGVVLRTYKLGEADRIVVFMTAERGKVRAVAKGVRKTKSRFGGRLESPNRARLLMYEGRQLDVVSQVETIEYFRPVRDDLTRMTEAMALVEAVEQVAQEGEANQPLYRMLVSALGTLSERPSPLLVAGFYWKLLGLEGIAPVVDRCVGCGSDLEGLAAATVAFDMVEGGALCSSCRPVSAGERSRVGRHSVSPAALDIIGRMLGGDLGGALATPAGPVAAEVSALATSALEGHLERRLRAVRALPTPNGTV